MKKLVADFETATWLPDETYVWAWSICNIDNPEEIEIGNSIESFIDYISHESMHLWFHNLKFDAEFIISELFKMGFEHIEDKKMRRDKTFTTLISDMGIFYSMEIYFKVDNKKGIKCTIYDSLKIIPLAVEDIPESFGIPYQKLNLDYNRPREKGYILKDYEIRYIKNDVVIVAKALKQMFDMSLTKMTIGSNALNSYKETKGNLSFSRLFPELSKELYYDLKPSYKGGFTYLNPIYEDITNGETINLDINSLYPWCMKVKPMPYGDPIFYEGKYKEDKVYPLYIQRITCSFELKKNKIPTIQIKGTRFYQENEYLKSSNGQILSLTLTSIDLKLFLEQYDVYNLDYWCGWKFKALTGIFDEYVDTNMQGKIEATRTKNKGKRTIHKLLLNSLYGKFSAKMKAQEKIPYYEDGIVKYKLAEEHDKKGLYLPIGAFITSYAREKTIRTSQAITDYSLEKYGKDMYIYSDTDSIKTLLPIDELTKFCEIDPVELGAWKYEGTAIRSKFIRQKTYLEEFIREEKNEKTGEVKTYNEIEITCAGMPKTSHKYVTWDNFQKGFTCGGKLTFSHVKGGVKLIETNFTIKF